MLASLITGSNRSPKTDFSCDLKIMFFQNVFPTGGGSLWVALLSFINFNFNSLSCLVYCIICCIRFFSKATNCLNASCSVAFLYFLYCHLCLCLYILLFLLWGWAVYTFHFVFSSFFLSINTVHSTVEALLQILTGLLAPFCSPWCMFSGHLFKPSSFSTLATCFGLFCLEWNWFVDCLCLVHGPILVAFFVFSFLGFGDSLCCFSHLLVINGLTLLP